MIIFVFWLCASVLLVSACVVLTKWLARRSPWLRWAAAALTTFVLTIASFGLSSSGVSNESITDLIPYQEVVRASYYALRGGTYPTFSLLLIAWMGLLTILIPVLLFIGLRSNPLSGKLGRATFWNLRRFGFASAIAIVVWASALAIEDWVVRSFLRETLAREESRLQQRQLVFDSVPLSDDAAPAYRRLGDTSQDLSVANEWLADDASIDFHKRVKPEQLTEFLSKSQNSLDALNEILQCPRVSMLTVQSLEDDESINLTALAVQWLIARCREKFDQGRSDDVWSDFLALGRLAEHASQVPSLPMHVARMRCWSAQSNLLGTLLAEGHIPSEVVARAIESESFDGSDSMVAAVEISFSEILADYCRTRSTSETTMEVEYALVSIAGARSSFFIER